MCDLLGMSFKIATNPNYSFTAFRELSDTKNIAGWGIAYYKNNLAMVIKEPLQAYTSRLAEFIGNYKGISTNIFLSHVRRGNEVSLMNTHPFYRTLNGKEYVFAHNGTITNYNEFSLKHFHPIGTKDSEPTFCHIMELIKKEQLDNWSSSNFKKLHKIFSDINKKGKFNCMLSDGKYLFCYYDNKKRNEMAWIRRKSPFPKIKLGDKEIEINLADKKNKLQEVIIVATLSKNNPYDRERKLTDEKWEKFAPGELKVITEGRIIFSSTEKDVSEKEFDMITLNILKIIKNHPTRIKIQEIKEKTNFTNEEVIQAIEFLNSINLIKQDGKDQVKCDYESARFYTRPERKREIAIISEK